VGHDRPNDEDRQGEIGEILSKYAEEKGIKILGYLPYWQEAQCLVSRKPLKIPSDCKGIMVRVNDDISAKLIKLWGGGGSYMAAGELYMALQRGTLNGAFANLPTSVERKWYEVAPYSVLIPYYAVYGVPFINKAYFYKLPKEFSRLFWTPAPNWRKNLFNWLSSISSGVKIL
jgi:TRAP-type C4-dicarboxylate transport system substrate-binding protein